MTSRGAEKTGNKHQHPQILGGLQRKFVECLKAYNDLEEYRGLYKSSAELLFTLKASRRDVCVKVRAVLYSFFLHRKRVTMFKRHFERVHLEVLNGE